MTGFTSFSEFFICMVFTLGLISFIVGTILDIYRATTNHKMLKAIEPLMNGLICHGAAPVPYSLPHDDYLERIVASEDFKKAMDRLEDKSDECDWCGNAYKLPPYCIKFGITQPNDMVCEDCHMRYITAEINTKLKLKEEIQTEIKK